MDCDPRTVRRGIQAGEIPAVRIGSTVRIPVPKVRAMLGLAAEGDTAGTTKLGEAS